MTIRKSTIAVFGQKIENLHILLGHSGACKRDLGGFLLFFRPNLLLCSRKFTKTETSVNNPAWRRSVPRPEALRLTLHEKREKRKAHAAIR